MDTFFVKPATNPDTGSLYLVMDIDNPGHTIPEEGIEKPRNAYWLRRIADGGLVEVPKKEGKNK